MESRQIERGTYYDRETTTRYATIVVDPGTDGFSPESRALLERANVIHERVHQVDVLDDGSIVGLYELRGDADEIRRGVPNLPGVVSYSVTGTDPVYVYLHERETEPAGSLLQELRSSRVVLDQPLEYRPDNTLRLTMIGEDEALRRTFDSLVEVVDVSLEETGEYHPELGDPVSLLTDRQHQILQLAVDHGYYEVPRQVTHQELAENVGLSQSTVAEHLQKIEALVLPRTLR